MNRVTPLLVIDTAALRVRKWNFIFDSWRITDEFVIDKPQMPRAQLMLELEKVRLGQPCEEAFA